MSNRKTALSFLKFTHNDRCMCIARAFWLHNTFKLIIRATHTWVLCSRFFFLLSKIIHFKIQTNEKNYFYHNFNFSMLLFSIHIFMASNNFANDWNVQNSWNYWFCNLFFRWNLIVCVFIWYRMAGWLGFGQSFLNLRITSVYEHFFVLQNI